MTDQVSAELSGFVFVQPHLKYGGAESQTTLILNRLVAKGYECTLILHKRTGALLDQLDPRVKVIELGFESHKALPVGALRLRKILGQIPDSLIITRLWSSILMVGMVARRVPRHKYVYYEDLDPRDHELYVGAGRLKKKVITRIFRKNEESLIANTSHVAVAMKEQYALDLTPRVIECGVDTERCRVQATAPMDRDTRPSPDALNVVTVGSLVPIKGLVTLFQHLSQLRQPIKWLIVGDGPLKKELAQYQSDTFVDLQLVGTTDNPFKYMANADFLLHGGLSESFGMVILEALSIGVPVMAHQANGPKEIARTLPDANLFLFDTVAFSSFESALQKVRDNRENTRGVHHIGPYDIEEVVLKWELELKKK